MPTHIALLRGINVGGHNKVSMTDLRQVFGSLGHTEVATYIQSGNVVFTPAGAGAGNAEQAAALEQAIASATGVSPKVVVLTAGELEQVVRDAAAYEHLVLNTLTRLPGVERLNSSVVLSTMKSETALPVE